MKSWLQVEADESHATFALGIKLGNGPVAICRWFSHLKPYSNHLTSVFSFGDFSATWKIPEAVPVWNSGAGPDHDSPGQEQEAIALKVGERAVVHESQAIHQNVCRHRFLKDKICRLCCLMYKSPIIGRRFTMIYHHERRIVRRRSRCSRWRCWPIAHWRVSSWRNRLSAGKPGRLPPGG